MIINEIARLLLSRISMAKCRIRTIVYIICYGSLACVLRILLVSFHSSPMKKSRLERKSYCICTSPSLEPYISENHVFTMTTPTGTVFSKQGYMLALHYFDQITVGSINLQS